MSHIAMSQKKPRSTSSMRKDRGIRITLMSLAALVLLFALGSMVFLDRVYRSHFRRVDEPQVSGYLRYRDVGGYEHRVVHFDSGKNTLTGYIWGEENDKGLVVISHGLGFGAEDYVPQTLYFVDQGWRVFAFDDTGTYASEGGSTVGLPQSAADLDAALAYVEADATLRDLPIMLFGHSWGAYAVAAVLPEHHEISAVASVSGFDSPMGLLAEQIKAMTGPLAYLEAPFEWAYQTARFGAAASVTAVDGINSTDAPVMIVHGSADEDIAYDGASIIAERTRITNPNVTFETRSAAGRNAHNSLFRSAAAAQYAAEKNQEYAPIFERYGGKIPDDVRAQFYAGVDKVKTSELDADLMGQINSLFAGSVSLD